MKFKGSSQELMVALLAPIFKNEDYTRRTVRRLIDFNAYQHKPIKPPWGLGSLATGVI